MMFDALESKFKNTDQVQSRDLMYWIVRNVIANITPVVITLLGNSVRVLLVILSSSQIARV